MTVSEHGRQGIAVPEHVGQGAAAGYGGGMEESRSPNLSPFFLLFPCLSFFPSLSWDPVDNEGTVVAPEVAPGVAKS